MNIISLWTFLESSYLRGPARKVHTDSIVWQACHKCHKSHGVVPLSSPCVASHESWYNHKYYGHTYITHHLCKATAIFAYILNAVRTIGGRFEVLSLSHSRVAGETNLRPARLQHYLDTKQRNLFSDSTTGLIRATQYDHAWYSWYSSPLLPHLLSP